MTFIKKILFNILFTEKEKNVIVNSLFRRAKDISTKHVKGDKDVRLLSQHLAVNIFLY